jgi:hypothetical protein
MSLALTFIRAIALIVGITVLWFTVDRVWQRICPDRASGATGCGACAKNDTCTRSKGDETCTQKS